MWRVRLWINSPTFFAPLPRCDVLCSQVSATGHQAPPPSGYAALQTAFPATSILLTCPDSSPTVPRLAVGAYLDARFSTPAAAAGLTTTARVVAVAGPPSAAVGRSVSQKVTGAGHTVYTVKVDCGLALGWTNVTCAIDGRANPLVVELPCPTLRWSPSCGYWDTAAGAWSHAGCTLVSITADGFYCSCTHLTEFSGRFRAVAADQQTVRNSINVEKGDIPLCWYSDSDYVHHRTPSLLILVCRSSQRLSASTTVRL